MILQFLRAYPCPLRGLTRVRGPGITRVAGDFGLGDDRNGAGR